MRCKECIHDGVCFYQETINDIDEWLDEFGCEHYKSKADVVEVKHGEWRISWEGWYPYCSCCGEEPAFPTSPLREQLTPYCANCGAKMKKEWDSGKEK